RFFLSPQCRAEFRCRLTCLLLRLVFTGSFACCIRCLNLHGLLRSRCGGGAATLCTFAHCRFGGSGLTVRLAYALLAFAGKQNRHVTEMSLLAIRTALGSRTHATTMLRWPPIDVRGLQPKLVGIDRNIRLLRRFVRIRDC